VGIVHDALIPMDFVPISSFNKQHVPNWEGAYEGLDFLQLFVGDFGGRERAFAAVLSRVDGSIVLWELTKNDQRENGDGRVTWVIEFPAFTWGREFDLKLLHTAEIAVDRLAGTVDFALDWRPDNQTCWIPWAKWQKCSPRNSAEDFVNPISYPLEEFGPCYISRMTMPKPDPVCAACNTGRPANEAFQFQTRLTVKGYCRIRSMLLHGELRLIQLYKGLEC